MSLLDPRLQAFISVVQHRTVHAAAKSLLLTQTGVTQRIRSIEKQLAVTLFTRSRKGMDLTVEGESLYRYCQHAMDLEGMVMSGLANQESQHSVHITLAGPTSIVSSRIIPNCFGLYEEFPNLVLSYRLNDQEERAQLLKKGIVQLSILPPEDVALEMDSKILRPDRYILVASAKWKNRRLRDIIKQERMVDFYESDLTTKLYLQKFALLELAGPDRIFANTNFAKIALIKAGIGYGTLTQEVAAKGIEKGELMALNKNQFLESPLALAWYPRKEMPKYFKKIIDSIH